VPKVNPKNVVNDILFDGGKITPAVSDKFSTMLSELTKDAIKVVIRGITMSGPLNSYAISQRGIGNAIDREFYLKDNTFEEFRDKAINLENNARIYLINNRRANNQLRERLITNRLRGCSSGLNGSLTLELKVEGSLGLESFDIKPLIVIQNECTVPLTYTADFSNNDFGNLLPQSAFGPLISISGNDVSKRLKADPILCCDRSNYWLFGLNNTALEISCRDFKQRSASEFSLHYQKLDKACASQSDRAIVVVVSIVIGGLAFVFVIFGIICWCCLMPSRRRTNAIVLTDNRLTGSPSLVVEQSSDDQTTATAATGVDSPTNVAAPANLGSITNTSTPIAAPSLTSNVLSRGKITPFKFLANSSPMISKQAPAAQTKKTGTKEDRSRSSSRKRKNRSESKKRKGKNHKNVKGNESRDGKEKSDKARRPSAKPRSTSGSSKSKKKPPGESKKEPSQDEPRLENPREETITSSGIQGASAGRNNSILSGATAARASQNPPKGPKFGDS